jgi:hypothetical protein
VKKLDGKVSSIRELLFGARFGINHFQGECHWERRRNRSSNGQFTANRLELKTLKMLDVS